MLVDIPAGTATVTVKLINPVNFGPSVIRRFMQPAVPGLETFPTAPSLSFLLEHPSGRRLVWDLGIRKDYHNYAPSITRYLPTTNYTISVTQNVADILDEHGIPPASIEAVIWSHWHWDHIGDPSSFPPSTDLVVGRGFKAGLLPGAPANPESPIQESDYANRTLREISFDGAGSLRVGPFAAFDYFGDGSFYLLDTPGHAIGHLCGLARTTLATVGSADRDTFVLLGGDVCHYSGILRPSRHMPVPDEVTLGAELFQESQGPRESSANHVHTGEHAHAAVTLCPGAAFADLQQSRGRAATDTLFDLCYGLDIPLATRTVGELQMLDCDDNVFVIIAHDATVRDTVAHFPAALNDWKAEGWGRRTRWAFFRDLEPYWRSRGLM